MNIIADVAGRYEELMILLARMPQGEEIVLLGDLNDRGPDTAKVIQWAIDNNICCVKSNHGDMLINAYNAHNHSEYDTVGPDRSDIYLFEQNGGYATLFSYGGMDKVPHEHLEYLVNCPWYIETDELLLSHAPYHPELNSYEEACNIKDIRKSFLWNREIPKRRDKFQIHGHNAYFEEYTDEQGVYGLCLDNSAHKVITGIHWPSRVVYSEHYK